MTDTNKIIVTGHAFKRHENPRYCDKLEVFTTHKGKESWYLIDISKGHGINRPSVQSATCIPLGTRASPRNVTNRMPIVVTEWVNTFLANQGEEV